MTTVNYTLDSEKQAQLTAEQLARLEALSDEDIDYSDIPELDEDFWQNAQMVNPEITPNPHLKVDRYSLGHYQH